MARISGKGGALLIGSTGTLLFKSFDIRYVTAAIDVTAFADTAKTLAVGIKSFSGSANAILDGATAPAMPTAIVSATFTAATGRTYIGDVIVTEIGPSVVIDGDAVCSVSFEGSGDLTIA